jgi:amino acid permease
LSILYGHFLVLERVYMQHTIDLSLNAPDTGLSPSTGAGTLGVTPPPAPSMAWYHRLIRTKSVEQEQNEGGHSGLHRSLTAWNLVLFGVTAMVGTGIFVLTGEAASMGAGPAVVVSLLITGILCGFCALCYSELSAMIPVAGSAYSYLYASLGELVAWTTGWVLLLEYLAGVMAIAIGWGETIKSFFAGLLHQPLPLVFTTNTVEILEGASQVANSRFTYPLCKKPLRLW